MAENTLLPHSMHHFTSGFKKRFFKKAQPSGFWGFYWFFGQAGKNR